MRNLLTILFLFGLIINSYSTDYYISNSGDDTNPGTIGSPKATPYGATLGSGDAFYFERGGHWDSICIGLSGLTGVTIGAYGSGVRPIVTIYDTLHYQSVASDVYEFYHIGLDVDYYVYLPWRATFDWKRYENNFGWLLDSDRNHYEMGRYQSAGTYSKLTTYSESDNTYFECLSLIDTEADDFHNGASGKVQIEPWWAEAFLIGVYIDATGRCNISNLISAGSGNFNSGHDHQTYFYNHRNYLLNNQVNNEWASNNETYTRDGYIWVYNDSDISADDYFLPVDTCVFSFLNCANVRISNIEFQGGHVASTAFYDTDSIIVDSCMYRNVHVGSMSYDCNKVYFRYDSVINATNMGIFDQYNESNLVVDNCYSFNTGTSEGGGGDSDVSFNPIWSRYPEGSVTVTNCHVDSCGRNGIHLKGRIDNLEYLVKYCHIEKYLTNVQDGAGIYISGSSGTQSTKIVRKCITSYGQYANQGFNCRSSVNHSGIYWDTDTRGVVLDSCTALDAYKGFKFNGTDTNYMRDCKSINHTISGIRFVDYGYGHYGTGTVDCEFYNNTLVTHDTNSFGYSYNTWAYSQSSPTYYFNGLGTDIDSNHFVNTKESAGAIFNMERYYNDYPLTQEYWVDTTENVLGVGNAWDENSYVNFANHYASVSGSIDADQCVIGIANATLSPQTVSLYDLTFYRADSTEVSGSITIQPFNSAELIYKAGTASNIDLLPYVIKSDISMTVGNVIPLLNTIKQKTLLDEVEVGFYLTE